VVVHCISVPCEWRSIHDRWKQENASDRIRESIGSSGGPRLPRRFEDGHRGLFEDLVEIGVLYRTSDGRVNVPDVFRVAFGLKRKGGVKPVR
jgi:hypothetical protein